MSGEAIFSILRRRFASGPTIAEAFGRGRAAGNNFDAIRLFAALTVLYTHAFLLTIGANPTDFLYAVSGGQTYFGDFAIGVFFVLSGFLIAQSWMRYPDLTSFARNRALRIMPALAVVVLAAVFIIGPVVSTLPANEYFAEGQTWRYLLNVLFLYRNDMLPGVFADASYAPIVNMPLWTLKFEVLCYALIALLGACRMLTARGCLLIVLACMVMSLIVESSVNSLFENFLRQFSVMGAWFFGGAFFAAAADRIRLNAALAISGAAILGLTLTSAGFDQAFAFAGAYLVLFIGLTSLGAVRHAGRFGDFSYGVYIWSWPIQQIAAIYAAPDSPMIVLAISLPATLAMACLSWNFIEKPALRLKSNGAFARRPSQPVFAGE
jgi:peptidoglycan/LPS O-acetylase OafA/YrhL